MTQPAKRPSTATRRTGGSHRCPTGRTCAASRTWWATATATTATSGMTAPIETSGTPTTSRASSGRVARIEPLTAMTEASGSSRTRRDEKSDQRQRGEQWHGARGELGDGREPRRESGGVQRTLEQVTDRARSATSSRRRFRTHPRHVEGSHGVVRRGRGHDEAAAAVLQHRAGCRKPERSQHHERLTQISARRTFSYDGKGGRERECSRRLSATRPRHHTRSHLACGSPACSRYWSSRRRRHRRGAGCRHLQPARCRSGRQALTEARRLGPAARICRAQPISGLLCAHRPTKVPRPATPSSAGISALPFPISWRKPFLQTADVLPATPGRWAYEPNPTASSTVAGW